MTHIRRLGFTLIELSIVLVIIGLVVSGTMVGNALIESARIRSQIGQLEQYQTAMRTFQSKYNGLPGDLPNAGSFGFYALNGGPGQGDGNGVIQGYGGSGVSGYSQLRGETESFWYDLAAAHLIEGSFYGTYPGCAPYVNKSPVDGNQLGCPDYTIADFLPKAKIASGDGVYVYVYSDDTTFNNYWGLSRLFVLTEGHAGYSLMGSDSPGLTTQQAFLMDSKVDDGHPLTGRVVALIPMCRAGDAPQRPSGGTFAIGGATDNSATTASTITCYDNDGSAGKTQHYSLEVDGGKNPNCAISLLF